MIPVLLSVGFGAAVYLLYEGLTNPRPARGDASRLRGLEEFLTRAGLAVTPRDFLLFSLGSGLAVGLLVQLFLGWGVVSVVAAGLGAAAPAAYYLHRHDRRRAAVQAALVEAIAQLRDAIRTGLSVPEALVALTRSGPEVLRPEFAALAREMRMAGLEPALAAMRDRLADPLWDLAAGALTLNASVGGRNVSAVLDRLVHAARAQLRAQEELRAQQSKNVLSARIVAAVPLALLVVVRALNPAYLAVFDTAAGQLVLAACVASVAVGYLGMLWITRLPGDPRVLRAPREAPVR